MGAVLLAIAVSTLFLFGIAINLLWKKTK
jgi:hypothetical protein